MDSATSLIQAAKNLMNAVVLAVKASYVASTKYTRATATGERVRLKRDQFLGTILKSFQQPHPFGFRSNNLSKYNESRNTSDYKKWKCFVKRFMANERVNNILKPGQSGPQIS